MYKQWDKVSTKQGVGIIERIDRKSYSIVMYIVRLLDGKKSDNGFDYVVKCENELSTV